MRTGSPASAPAERRPARAPSSTGRRTAASATAASSAPTAPRNSSTARAFAAAETQLTRASSEAPRWAPRSHYARKLRCARSLRLSGNASEELARFLLLCMDRDVGLRNHADEALVLAGHGQTPDLMLRHEVERVGEIVIRVDGDELARRDLGRRHPAGVFALGDRAHDDVSIGDDPHESIAVHDRNGSDVLGLHHFCDLIQRRLRGHRTWPRRHYIPHLGAHSAPFGVSSVLPGIASLKPRAREDARFPLTFPQVVE